MEIGIRVEAENIRTGERRHTNSCYFTMVAVNEAGKPIAVPELVIDSDMKARRKRAAEERRALRQEFEARFEKAKAGVE